MVLQHESVLKKMKKSRSSGVDGISSEVIKPVIKELSPAIVEVINSSLREGVFSEAGKTSNIRYICICYHSIVIRRLSSRALLPRDKYFKCMFVVESFVALVAPCSGVTCHGLG